MAFFPIRLKFESAGPVSCRGKDYLTGFECALSNFDYADELKRVQNPPKPNFLQKLLFQQTQPQACEFLGSRDTDKLLMNCKMVFEIYYHRSSQEMIVSAFAAVLAELTDGIMYDPQSDEYRLPKDALADIPALIAEPPMDEWDPFPGW